MALFKKREAIIKFASIDENGEINVDEFKKQINEKTKIIWRSLIFQTLQGQFCP